MKNSLSARKITAILRSVCYHLLQLYQRSRFCSKRIRSFHTQSFQAKILRIDKQPTQIIPWKNLILKMVDFRLRFSSPVFPQQFSAQLARLENGFWKAKFRGVESFGKIGERQAKISGFSFAKTNLCEKLASSKQ